MFEKYMVLYSWQQYNSIQSSTVYHYHIKKAIYKKNTLCNCVLPNVHQCKTCMTICIFPVLSSAASLDSRSKYAGTAGDRAPNQLTNETPALTMHTADL